MATIIAGKTVSVAELRAAMETSPFACAMPLELASQRTEIVNGVAVEVVLIDNAALERLISALNIPRRSWLDRQRVRAKYALAQFRNRLVTTARAMSGN